MLQYNKRLIPPRIVGETVVDSSDDIFVAEDVAVNFADFGLFVFFAVANGGKASGVGNNLVVVFMPDEIVKQSIVSLMFFGAPCAVRLGLFLTLFALAYFDERFSRLLNFVEISALEYRARKLGVRFLLVVAPFGRESSLCGVGNGTTLFVLFAFVFVDELFCRTVAQ